jgi:hypothetical protein
VQLERTIRPVGDEAVRSTQVHDGPFNARRSTAAAHVSAPLSSLDNTAASRQRLPFTLDEASSPDLERRTGTIDLSALTCWNV